MGSLRSIRFTLNESSTHPSPAVEDRVGLLCGPSAQNGSKAIRSYFTGSHTEEQHIWSTACGMMQRAKLEAKDLKAVFGAKPNGPSTVTLPRNHGVLLSVMGKLLDQDPCSKQYRGEGLCPLKSCSLAG